MTTILDAALSATVAEAAMKFREAGCSIIPVQGKQPAMGLKNWKVFTHQLPPMSLVRQWTANKYVTGIGLIGGAVSGGLVLLDIDSMDACDEFEANFPDLLTTLTVRSGSGRGRHYYFYAHALPGNAWRAGCELRCEGAYVVAPPSIHASSGLPYRVERLYEPLRVFSLATVRKWILERGGGAAAVTPKPARTDSGIRNASAYGSKALLDQASIVAHATEGMGNRTLYLAALKMGSLIASGHLTQTMVEIELEAAAAGLSARDGVEATRNTIQSGLRTGMGNPRPEKVG